MCSHMEPICKHSEAVCSHMEPIFKHSEAVVRIWNQYLNIQRQCVRMWNQYVNIQRQCVRIWNQYLRDNCPWAYEEFVRFLLICEEWCVVHKMNTVNDLRYLPDSLCVVITWDLHVGLILVEHHTWQFYENTRYHGIWNWVLWQRW